MNDNRVKIIVYENNNSFINYLVYNNIHYDNLEKFNDYFSLIVEYSCYEKIIKRYKCDIIKFYGGRGIINFIYFHRFIFVSLVISMFVLFLLSNTIFSVVINCDDEELYNKINDSLFSNGIVEFKRKKNFSELVNIKKNILNELNDFLEWIEISEKGTKYIIDVTPRVKKSESNDLYEPCDIVASRDGLIKHIVSSKGVKLKDVNDYVKKGDVIISGNIYKDDKLIDQVKASGFVYAETWYTVNISVPFNYIEYVETDEIVNHYYLDVFGYQFTLLGKYESNETMNNKILLIDKPYLFFKLYKEEKRKYKYIEFNISEEEAYDEAIRRSDVKISDILDDDEYVISKNVLKKEVKSSKMYIEVFFKVYEKIGVASNIGNIGEKNEFDS